MIRACWCCRSSRGRPQQSRRCALQVNPYDLSQTAQALERALAMPLAERQARHADNFASLRRDDLSRWRETFLADLRSVAAAASVTLRAGRRVANA